MQDQEERNEELLHIHEISDLCKQTFLDKDTAIRAFWGICFFLITVFGSAVAWAMSMNGTVSSLETKSIYQEQKINQLDESINKKLDILIDRDRDKDRERFKK